MLATTAPNVRRRPAGSSWAQTMVGLFLLGGGLFGLIGATALPEMNPLRFAIVSSSVVAFIAGFLLATWAGPEVVVQTMAKVVRFGESIGRIAVRAISAFLSVAALALIGAAETARVAPYRVSEYVLAFIAGVIAIVTAVSAVSSGSAIVAVRDRNGGYKADRISMIVWCVACGTVGTLVGAVVAHTFSAAAIWPSVTLTLAGLFISVFAQRHKDLQANAIALEKSLADLYQAVRCLPAGDTGLWKAAMDVQSALSVRPWGSHSLAPPPLLSYELKAALLYLIEVTSKLAINGVTDAERAALDRCFGEVDLMFELEQLIWSIRSDLIRVRG